MAVDDDLQIIADTCERRVGRALYLPKFSLLSTHPAMCGLMMQCMRHELRLTTIDMAGCQGQILTAVHLYNAARVSGLLPDNLHWADMDHFIEKQGSDWIFVERRPQDPRDIIRRMLLARGLGASKFSKDYRHSNARNVGGIDGGYNLIRKIRHFEYLARYSELTLDKSATLSSLATLSAFKNAIQKDDCAFHFNFMDLYLRCVRLLGSIQAHCLQHAPHDFPQSGYGHGLGMNDVITPMMTHYFFQRSHNIPVFPEAVKILCKVIEEEGDVVLKEAKTQEKEMKAYRTVLEAMFNPSSGDPIEETLDLN